MCVSVKELSSMAKTKAITTRDCVVVLESMGWEEQEAVKAMEVASGHLLVMDALVDYLEGSYDRLSRYALWRVESYCAAPGVDELGGLLDEQSPPVDTENAAANVLARAWRRLSRRKASKLQDDYLKFSRYNHGHEWTLRAIWRQAIKAEARTWRWGFGGSGSRKVSFQLLGDYNPAATAAKEMDIQPLWDWFGSLQPELAGYGLTRFLGMLGGEEPRTMDETASLLGVSRRTVLYRAKEFRSLALEQLADAFA